MSEKLGFDVYTVGSSKILRDGYYKYSGGTILSGENKTYTVEGAVLCYSGGKYKVYYAPTQKTDEVATATPTPNGTAKEFFLQIASAGSIEPGSVTVTYTAGAAAKTVGNDNSEGYISSANGRGNVDYANGTIWLNCATAPDNASQIKITYKHYTPGRHVPSAILVKATDASTADAYTSIYITGSFVATRLTPDLNDNEYAKSTLRKYGLYVF